MRQPNATARACDRICNVASSSQDIANLRKTHFAMCICRFENTFEQKKVVISIGGASRSTGQPLRPQRLSGQGRTGQASNKYEKKNNDVNGQFEWQFKWVLDRF